MQEEFDLRVAKDGEIGYNKRLKTETRMSA